MVANMLFVGSFKIKAVFPTLLEQHSQVFVLRELAKIESRKLNEGLITTSFNDPER